MEVQKFKWPGEKKKKKISQAWAVFSGGFWRSDWEPSHAVSVNQALLWNSNEGMNSTVGWQYTLRSVMFNALAETANGCVADELLRFGFLLLTWLMLFKWFLKLIKLSLANNILWSTFFFCIKRYHVMQIHQCFLAIMCPSILRGVSIIGLERFLYNWTQKKLLWVFSQALQVNV